MRIGFVRLLGIRSRTVSGLLALRVRVSTHQRCVVSLAGNLAQLPRLRLLERAADTVAADKAANWFGGLDQNRLEWAEGRDFELTPKSKERPDLVIRGWVEINGKPYPNFQRTLHFTSEPVPTTGATVALKSAQ